MKPQKSQYVCAACGAVSPKWLGQCGDCSAWNSLSEVVIVGKKGGQHSGGMSGQAKGEITRLASVAPTSEMRYSSGQGEFDRALGGGLVQGAVVLLGGDPGIGKSTLLLQSACFLSNEHRVLYVTGEESLEQVSLRANRLGLLGQDLLMLAETMVENIVAHALKEQPRVLIVDSIQTLMSEALESAPGSVSQVLETAAQLVRLAKSSGITVFLVGHVTKEGAIAGPRVLEHMVDTVVYFEGSNDSRFRALRAVKNRFGAVNELGVFAMTERGLKGVSNPSMLLISKHHEETPGSAITVMWEGTRPLLCEVQALVDESRLDNPRRVAIGIDPQRLTLILAVLNRHARVTTGSKDVFVNIVGGLRLSETAADLALAAAIISSQKDFVISPKTILFGELGLGGEIRPVPFGQERLKEAAKLGYQHAIAPKDNIPKSGIDGMTTTAIKKIDELAGLLG